MKKFLVMLGLTLMIAISAGASYAQGPTPTSASGGFGGFFGNTDTVPTPSANGGGVGNDAVRQALAKGNYVVVTSGPWYDAAGKPLATAVHVFMLAGSPDPKSSASVQQIAAGFAALRNAFPTALTYHVLLLSGATVYDASTTSNTLQLLSSQLITADAFIQQVLKEMRTISLVGGATTGGQPTTVPTTASVATRVPTRVATRVPTRVPTTASSGCNAPAGQARLWVKNGYRAIMRFTVGGGEWGTHDYDIPADGQYHFIDMPPGNKYTYSASIPGVGKASAKLPAYSAGQCYFLTFTP